LPAAPRFDMTRFNPARIGFDATRFVGSRCRVASRAAAVARRVASRFITARLAPLALVGCGRHGVFRSVTAKIFHVGVESSRRRKYWSSLP
jgi:hypothetical protein